jgi:hypothetical protein
MRKKGSHYHEKLLQSSYPHAHHHSPPTPPGLRHASATPLRRHRSFLALSHNKNFIKKNDFELLGNYSLHGNYMVITVITGSHFALQGNPHVIVGRLEGLSIVHASFVHNLIYLNTITFIPQDINGSPSLARKATHARSRTHARTHTHTHTHTHASLQSGRERE